MQPALLDRCKAPMWKVGSKAKAELPNAIGTTRNVSALGDVWVLELPDCN